MRTIWKFALRGGEENQYFAELPSGAEVLSCGWQGSEFVVWAKVNPENRTTVHRFHIAGTGHDLPADIEARDLIGRVEIRAPSGVLIFHVFNVRVF